LTSGYWGFVPKEARKKGHKLTFHFYYHGITTLLISAFSTEKHILPNNSQVEIQSQKYLLPQKSMLQLCRNGWAQLSKWKSCEASVKDFIFIGNLLQTSRLLPYI